MDFIYKGNSKSAGIYKLTNRTNGRIYIGSSSRFEKRWKQHEAALRNGKHSNKFLLADFNKCGTDAFVFKIVEIMEGTQEERLLKEEFYIKQHYDGGNQCYNFSKTTTWTTVGIKHSEQANSAKSEIMKKRWKEDKSFKDRMTGENSPCYGKPRTEEVKKAISEKARGNQRFLGRRQTDEAKKKIGDGNRGKVHSLEQNKQHSIALKGKKPSAETVKKRADAIRGYKQSDHQKQTTRLRNSKSYDIKLLSPSGEIFGPITNIMEFSREHKLLASSLYGIINGYRKTHKGWKIYRPDGSILPRRDGKNYNVKLLAPDGSVYGPIYGLIEFCRTHHLAPSTLPRVFDGRAKHHKGWTLLTSNPLSLFDPVN